MMVEGGRGRGREERNVEKREVENRQTDEKPSKVEIKGKNSSKLI